MLNPVIHKIFNTVKIQEEGIIFLLNYNLIFFQNVCTVIKHKPVILDQTLKITNVIKDIAFAKKIYNSELIIFYIFVIYRQSNIESSHIRPKY